MNHEKVIERIKENEGFSATVYKDINGFDTIGYGKRVDFMHLSKEVSGLMINDDYFLILIWCYNKFDWFRTQPDDAKGVIVEMVYQLGMTGFCKFKKTIEFLKAKDYKSAAVEMMDSQWGRIHLKRAKILRNIIKACNK